FTVLMRAAGIPARVVTGYTGGYRNPFGGYWVVRRMDAHAWVEVWLDGQGWVRVDPTAAVAPERIYDTLEQRAAGAGGQALLRLDTLGDFTDWLRRGWNDLVLGFDAARQQAMPRTPGLARAAAGPVRGAGGPGRGRHGVAAGARRARARSAAARLAPPGPALRETGPGPGPARAGAGLGAARGRGPPRLGPGPAYTQPTF